MQTPLTCSLAEPLVVGDGRTRDCSFSATSCLLLFRRALFRTWWKTPGSWERSAKEVSLSDKMHSETLAAVRLRLFEFSFGHYAL